MTPDLITYTRARLTEAAKLANDTTDPVAMLADIEVKCRILDEHEHVPAVQQSYSDEHDFGCQTCHNDPDCGQTRALGWCTTVRLLASSYSALLGFEESWKL